jgi:hypothetical protein
MYKVLLKFVRSFCGQEDCALLFAVNISLMGFEAYFCHIVLIVQISLPYKMAGEANVLYNFNLVLLWSKFGFSVLFKSPVFVKNL